MKRNTQLKTGTLVILLLAAACLWAAHHGEATQSDTASISVTIHVMPFAEITLTAREVSLTVSGDAMSVSRHVGGDVTCNMQVRLFADVTPPEGSPPDWTWTATVSNAALAAGIHTIEQLLSVTIEKGESDAVDETVTLRLEGHAVDSADQVEQPGAGTATVTVVPHHE